MMIISGLLHLNHVQRSASLLGTTAARKHLDMVGRATIDFMSQWRTARDAVMSYDLPAAP